MQHLLFLLLVAFVNGDTVVQTKSGPVRGTSLDTKKVEAYLSIPYAEPPVGKLRFAKPVPKSPWTETLDAKETPVACVQALMEEFSSFNKLTDRMKETSEDCLYLNLWVPKTQSTLKPVMVFIHGGGFMMGSSNIGYYDGANLAERGDVIVASMNYRVGTLGFFTAFIDEAAGNMAMYDQVLALQWIKDNAKHFGGDPDNIVIFGESAGAYSVSLHMISPLSRNLFKRGIMQSGTAVNPVYSNDNAALISGCQTISKHVGCATDDDDLKENPQKVVECMKSLPAEKFIEADTILFKKLALLIPRVGDEFLPMTPTDLLRKGDFKDTEVLLGVARDEGSLFTIVNLGYDNLDFFGEKMDVNAFDETKAKEMVQDFLKDEQHAKIVQKYFRRVTEENRYSYFDAVSDILGDSYITCSTVFYADFQSLKKHPVYFYVFDYRSPLSKYPDWAGVPHFEDTPYVFGHPLHKAFSDIDKEVSKDVMNMWISFARTGNPSLPGGLKWPKYSYKDPKYLAIGSRDKLGVKPDNFRCEAWRKLWDSIIDEKVIQNFKKSKTEL